MITYNFQKKGLSLHAVNFQIIVSKPVMPLKLDNIEYKKSNNLNKKK